MSYVDLHSFQAEAHKVQKDPAKDLFLASLNADKASKMSLKQIEAAQVYIASAHSGDSGMNRVSRILEQALNDLAQQARIDQEHEPQRLRRAPVTRATRNLADSLLPSRK